MLSESGAAWCGQTQGLSDGVTPASPPQGCPEAQPGLQAQEASPTTRAHHSWHVYLPHGLQWHAAAVASSSAPLSAQGCLQGQGKPQQLGKGRSYLRSGGLGVGGQGYLLTCRR